MLERGAWHAGYRFLKLRPSPNVDSIIRSTDTLHAIEGGVLAEGVSSGIRKSHISTAAHR